MSNGRFGTNAEQMAKTAVEVDQVSQNISAVLGSLHAEVESTAGHWRGQAATSFQRLMVNWNEQSVQLTRALSAISEQLRESGRGYSSSDEAAMSSLNSAGLNLN